MLPEVRATVTMRFHEDSMRRNPFPRYAPFENMLPECYKSGLRHALDFASICANCGCAGKGFPAVWHRVFVPFRTNSHPTARLASAWREPLPPYTVISPISGSAPEREAYA